MKVLDAPGVIDDFYAHVLDWSTRNVLAVALGHDAFLFDAPSGRAERLATLRRGESITSLRWTNDGAHVGIGTSSGEVQIWDVHSAKQLRSMRGHTGRIGAVAWHNHILSSGAADAEIHQHDVRVREHMMMRRTGVHEDLVCGLDYNIDGVLASGGNDNLVCIWDDVASAKPAHMLSEHSAAIKALKWCPWQRNVLATGGGTADRKLCLWNAATGRLLQSADAESQVTGIVWSEVERELLTSHGYSKNQLSLWRYPSLAKVTDLHGHQARILGMAQSPDGSLVCSASADETLRFWQAFRPPSREQRGAADRAAPRSILKTIR